MQKNPLIVPYFAQNLLSGLVVKCRIACYVVKQSANKSSPCRILEKQTLMSNANTITCLNQS
jgi:hypothetical protein